MYLSSDDLPFAEQYVLLYVLCCWLEGSVRLRGPTLTSLADLLALAGC